MHNILQDQLIDTDAEFQELPIDSTMYELDVSQTFEQLCELRSQLNDCFRAAYEKASAAHFEPAACAASTLRESSQ